MLCWELSTLIRSPCSPWCTTQAGGAQRRLMMHNLALYHWSGAQCSTVPKTPTHRYTSKMWHYGPYKLESDNHGPLRVNQTCWPIMGKIELSKWPPVRMWNRFYWKVPMGLIDLKWYRNKPRSLLNWNMTVFIELRSLEQIQSLPDFPDAQ